MTKPIKITTTEEREKICKRYGGNCNKCSLRFKPEWLKDDKIYCFPEFEEIIKKDLHKYEMKGVMII